MTTSLPTMVAGDLARLLNGDFDFVHLPAEALLTTPERAATLEALDQLPFQFSYPGMPSCWGKGFENFLSLSEYLAPHPQDAQVADLCQPIHQRISGLLTAMGIQVAPLVDDATQQAYPQADFRLLVNAPQQTMLHLDDLVHDGRWKSDFVLPAVLQQHAYRQLMVMVVLDTQGPPATLRSYARKYTPADEQFRRDNQWQFDDAVVAGSAYHDFQPQAGDAFIMANQYYHDIMTGDTATEWLTSSLYLLYLPDLNLALTYV
jgi:hypothetical protein